ncbi:MAG TPA: NADH-quinone oxidoreductase subunit M [Phycisphaerales bacterium]|nr:NADH-quinone oxidoreductase subunit M [Phycisphaerales bacterium]
MLIYLISIPLLFAVLVLAAPREWARITALCGTLIALAVAVFAMLPGEGRFNWATPAEFQYAHTYAWLPQLGLNFSVGVDSVALLLIALTALLGPICVQASATTITQREKTYYSWLLVLQAAMTGVFAARDLVLFYTCFEFTLVPMFVLISLYGSTNRKKAAVKFFLYTFTGSIIALAGLVYVAWKHAHNTGGEWTFDIATLQQVAASMSPREQAWVMLAMLAGFAVKVPLFPVHTWLPLAHTEAPTAGSVILAGVLLKLGTYALYRFVLPFTPAAVVEYAPAIGVLCIIGIIYGGLICWVQKDVKKLVAYSSVAHLGFCILGMFALNNNGLTGSILYMINHGLSTGALFLLIGMVYERYHTRSMNELGGLAAKMPVWATFMVFFTMASVGLPGLNGFVSEFLCLLGTFQSSSAWGSSTGLTEAGLPDAGLWGSAQASVPGATHGGLGPWFAAIAGIGMIIAAIYLLYMCGKIVWGPLVEPAGHGHHHHAVGTPTVREGSSSETNHEAPLPTDLSRREIGILLPLAVLCIYLGVYPKHVLQVLQPPIDQTLKVVNAAAPLKSVPIMTNPHAAVSDETVEAGR